MSDYTNGNIIEKNQEEDVLTYLVSASGFEHDNVLEIKINTASKLIESVSYREFKDTVGIGDLTDTPDFFSQFVGLNIDNVDVEVDVVSGATYTSESVFSAVYLAMSDANLGSGLNDGNQEVSIVDVSETDDLMTYLVSSKGLENQNKIEIVINKESRLIESVSFNEFNDTPGIGDRANSPEFLNQFVGLSIDGPMSEVDIVSDATYTSNSVIKAVETAISDAVNR